MSRDPDPSTERHRRAMAELRADHAPRQLHHEPRLSRADERDLTDRVRRGERDEALRDLEQLLERMNEDLERARALLARVAPGDHRGYLREIQHGLRGIARAIP